MRAEGLWGVVRETPVITTCPDTSQSERPDDLVKHRLMAERPNALWVADFTEVPSANSAAIGHAAGARAAM